MATKLNKRMKIHSQDRCSHCGHPSCDEEDGFRIYTEARAKWLEHAAAQLVDADWDDEWHDWLTLGEELTKQERKNG